MAKGSLKRKQQLIPQMLDPSAFPLPFPACLSHPTIILQGEVVSPTPEHKCGI